MDRESATEGLSAAIAAWSRYLKIARAHRLHPDKFAAYLPFHFDQHPLPPIVIADTLLRPTERHRESLDSRVPLYLNVLIKQRRVDVAPVLRALYKYSSIHLRVPSQDVGALAGEEHLGGKREKKQIVRWRNSYADEETILWRLAQLVHQGRGIMTAKKVIHVSKVLVAWMGLFTEAAAAFSSEAFGSLHGLQARDETEDARNAFVLFLLAFSQSPRVLSTLGKPASKGRGCSLSRGSRARADSLIGICKMLSDAMKAFLPCVMQLLPVLVNHLELFRTDVLGKYLPAEKKDAAEVNSYMDSLIGLDSLQVPEVPIVNSRAGLYIYLSAAVSILGVAGNALVHADRTQLVGRPMIDDAALFTYLHNRYQVRTDWQRGVCGFR